MDKLPPLTKGPARPARLHAPPFTPQRLQATDNGAGPAAPLVKQITPVQQLLHFYCSNDLLDFFNPQSLGKVVFHRVQR